MSESIKKSKPESNTSTNSVRARSTHKPRSGRVSRPKVVVILGPTSSGKSELAVQLAQSFGGEVVSADSRQVYKGLDISSSKVPGAWQRRGRRRFFIYKGIAHHMIDLVSPKRQYTAGQFKKKAKRAIGDILRRHKLPIVAGGTGFYIDALIHNLDFPSVKPQKKLRKELETLTTEQLIRRLEALDPRRANEIDKRNRRRLIRAIEIVVLSKSQIPPLEHNHRDDPYDALVIGLKLPDQEIKGRLDKIVEDRVASGVVDEIRRAHKKGASWDRIEDLGMEYRSIVNYIKDRVSLDEMKESMKKEYWQYVKRQMTWFKRDPNIIWIDAPEKAFPIVRDFLDHGGAPLPGRQET